MSNKPQKPQVNRLEVPNVQEDSISSVSWSPNSMYFCGTSWNCQARIWEFGGNSIIARSQVQHEMPIFSNCFSLDNSSIYTVGADTQVKKTDLRTNQNAIIGKHDLPIRSIIRLSNDANVVGTGSWDRSVRFWDGKTPNPVINLTLLERVYSMYMQDSLLGVALADRNAHVYDIRNTKNTLFSHKPNAQNSIGQLTSISIFPKKEVYVYSNDEGRIQVNFFKEQGKTKNYAFRTQRNIEKKEFYPVHDICFHPLGQLATGGGDGSYTFWDLFQEDKCLVGDVHHPTHLPVVALSFSYDGRFLAAANSYDWAKGAEGYNPAMMRPQIFIHVLQENELKVRK